MLYDENSISNTLGETDMYKKFLKIQDKLIKTGLFRSNPLKRKLRCFHCMADNDSSVIITSKGEIGKCEHFTNKHLLGNIYDSKIDSSEFMSWKAQYQPTQKCFNCPLYPQCVRIKMCPEEHENCSIEQCENKIELIKRALIKEYEYMQKKLK